MCAIASNIESANRNSGLNFHRAEKNTHERPPPVSQIHTRPGCNHRLGRRFIHLRSFFGQVKQQSTTFLWNAALGDCFSERSRYAREPRFQGAPIEMIITNKSPVNPMSATDSRSTHTACNGYHRHLPVIMHHIGGRPSDSQISWPEPIRISIMHADRQHHFSLFRAYRFNEFEQDRENPRPELARKPSYCCSNEKRKQHSA